MSQMVRNGEEKGILLTFDELQLLLCSCGVEEWEGIAIPVRTYEEQEVVYTIHHLIAKKILIEQMGKIVIREDVKTMLQMMGNPLRTQIYNFQQEYFCYEDAEKVVVTERYWKRKDTIKLRLFEQEEFQNWKVRMTDDNC